MQPLRKSKGDMSNWELRLWDSYFNLSVRIYPIVMWILSGCGVWGLFHFPLWDFTNKVLNMPPKKKVDTGTPKAQPKEKAEKDCESFVVWWYFFDFIFCSIVLFFFLVINWVCNVVTVIVIILNNVGFSFFYYNYIILYSIYILYFYYCCFSFFYYMV